MGGDVCMSRKRVVVCILILLTCVYVGGWGAFKGRKRHMLPCVISYEERQGKHCEGQASSYEMFHLPCRITLHVPKITDESTVAQDSNKENKGGLFIVVPGDNLDKRFEIHFTFAEAKKVYGIAAWRILDAYGLQPDAVPFLKKKVVQILDEHVQKQKVLFLEEHADIHFTLHMGRIVRETLETINTQLCEYEKASMKRKATIQAITARAGIFLCKYMKTQPLAQQTARNYAVWIVEASEKRGIDPFVLAGLIEAESSWNTCAVSSVGARGLGQVMSLHMPWIRKKYPKVKTVNDLFIPEIGINVSADILQLYYARAKKTVKAEEKTHEKILKKALHTYSGGARSTYYVKIQQVASHLRQKAHDIMFRHPSHLYVKRDL